MEKQHLLVHLLFCLLLLTSYRVHGELFNSLECFSNNITYSNFNVDFYFSSRNQLDHHKLTAQDIESGNFDFDPKRRTVVIVHGLFPQIYETIITLLRESLLQWGDVNLIQVDWSKGCTDPITYAKAVVNTENAAIKISELFGNLIKTWKGTEKSVEKWSPLYIIGHSLGAHVAGQSAARLKKEHNLLVDRVTGLDPAGPCFDTDSHVHLHLKKSDASFVDIVHTDGGTESRSGFGTLEPIGHIDFYVNGGRSQPSCSANGQKIESTNSLQFDYHLINKNGLCQHFRAYTLFTDTLKQATNDGCTFWAHPWSDIRTGQAPKGLESCNKETCIEMGINAEKYKNKNGIYYARTSRGTPFCRFY